MSATPAVATRRSIEMRRPALLMILLAALACRPSGRGSGEALSSVTVADSSQPPVVACMDAVFTGSPMIERSLRRRVDDPRARYVALRNPPSERTPGLAFVIEPKTGTPRQLVVSFPWPRPWRGTGMVAPMDPKITDMEGEALTDMGTSLAREIRAQCAPMAPGEISCTRVEQGQRQRCVAGI